MKSILYVRLPCWKIYPEGVIRLADYIHKHESGIKQFILDLSLAKPGERKTVLLQAIEELKPAIVAFSWRNIQTFAPHDDGPGAALTTVFKFNYAPSLLGKLSAVFEGFGLILDYHFQVRQNLSYINLAKKKLPHTKIVVGGTAFTIYPEEIIRQCPQGTIGVIGEGESALLKIIRDEDLSNEEVIIKKADGTIVKGEKQKYFKLEELTPIDFDYIQAIFPDFSSFLDGDVGIQTKRGCPYNCIFCIYNHIEGKEQRFRNPRMVVEEIEILNRKFGVDKIWFTDSQFCATEQSIPHAEEVLDEILTRKLAIQWTGYIRIENLSFSFIKKALASGITSFNLSFSGSQDVIDQLRLGYRLEKQLETFKMIKETGFSNQQIKLYLPLNAPGETNETLLETIRVCQRLDQLFGEARVEPWIFFLGIQPKTLLEKYAIETGYLKPDYDPLTRNPFLLKRLLYNPPPLGKIIARAYLEARTKNPTQVGKETLKILEKKLVGE